MPAASPELICVDPERIFDFWQYARPFIEKAIEATNLTPFAEIEKQVLDGDQLLWLAWNGKIEGAGTTRLVNGVCEIVAWAGENMNHWLHLEQKIEAYAKAEKCRCIRIVGRPGWERVLDGYKKEYVILEKAIL